MPRTRPLTNAQREREEIGRVCDDLLAGILASRGAERETLEQIAKDVGISYNTLLNWRNGGMETVQLGRAVKAALRRGYRIKIESVKAPRKGNDSEAAMELLRTFADALVDWRNSSE